jgi:hypothetical protein
VDALGALLIINLSVGLKGHFQGKPKTRFGTLKLMEDRAPAEHKLKQRIKDGQTFNTRDLTASLRLTQSIIFKN